MLSGVSVLHTNVLRPEDESMTIGKHVAVVDRSGTETKSAQAFVSKTFTYNLGYGTSHHLLGDHHHSA
jgi:hypothetical protein